MHITREDVPRVRFFTEAPLADDAPDTHRLTATLYDSRLFFQRSIADATPSAFVRWVELSGHQFTSASAVAGFHALAGAVLAELLGAVPA